MHMHICVYIHDMNVQLELGTGKDIDIYMDTGIEVAQT